MTDIAGANNSTKFCNRLQQNNFWNSSIFSTYFFNALSILLPTGEAFIIKVIESAADGVTNKLLQTKAQHFVADEQAHQNAHHIYNYRLQEQGYPISELEKPVAQDLQKFSQQWSLNRKIAIVAAIEYLTATLARCALANHNWLTPKQNREAQLWRWHCQEELAHYQVALDMVAQAPISYGLRVTSFLLVILLLAVDVTNNVIAFYRIDRKRKLITRTEFYRSLLMFIWQGKRNLLLILIAVLRYLMPGFIKRGSQYITRFLTHDDIPQLLKLESQKWDEGQMADAQALANRIEFHPDLSIGVFCTSTGDSLCSLFMRPVTPCEVKNAKTWYDVSTNVSSVKATHHLFGISLSSTKPIAVIKAFEFFWPYALKNGYRFIFLGSPMNGLRKWYEKNSEKNVEKYALSVKNKLPIDPQLRYYHKKGFTTIEAVKPNYFPHKDSLNYAAILKGKIPLSSLIMLRYIPFPALKKLSEFLFRFF